jgi:hypothetical protein
MCDDDMPALARLLDDVAALRRDPPYTATQKAMWFRVLRDYPLAVVRAGLDAHMRDPDRGTYAPMPADVIRHATAARGDDGRPGPEEAWMLALRGRDERATIVWTHETAQAWGIASPAVSDGDLVAGRMAFREAYTRLVDEARARGMPVAWSVSEGHDPRGRTAAVAEAVSAGRLPMAALDALPAPDVGDPPLLALDGPVSLSGAPAAARDALRALADSLRARDAVTIDPAAIAERDRLAALKRDADARVRAYVEGGAS